MLAYISPGLSISFIFIVLVFVCAILNCLVADLLQCAVYLAYLHFSIVIGRTITYITQLFSVISVFLFECIV